MDEAIQAFLSFEYIWFTYIHSRLEFLFLGNVFVTEPMKATDKIINVYWFQYIQFLYVLAIKMVWYPLQSNTDSTHMVFNCASHRYLYLCAINEEKNNIIHICSYERLRVKVSFLWKFSVRQSKRWDKKGQFHFQPFIYKTAQQPNNLKMFFRFHSDIHGSVWWKN